jgi:HNH endonuclease
MSPFTSERSKAWWATMTPQERSERNRQTAAKVISDAQALARLLRSCRFEGDCWIWTGSACTGGYGHLRLGGWRHYRPRQTILVHRLSYELHKGSIPDGLTIDHLCRQRRCFNPNHLDAVTMRENTMRSDAVTAVHARKTHCPAGHPYVLISGRRSCRICRRASTARYNARHRAKYLANKRRSRERRKQKTSENA